MGTTTENMYHAGSQQFANLVPNPGAISDAHVAAGAGIQATKLQFRRTIGYAQPNTTATTETRALHVAHGTTGSIVAFRAGSIAINAGAATVTLDLRKNGVSVLSAPITLNNANAARVAVAGTVTTATLAAGDLLEVVITATAGGGTLATGVFCQVVTDESAQ